MLIKKFLGGRLIEGLETVQSINKDLCLVIDSDPSQEEAILETKTKDISLIQGPPGTGKSQTIVNIIADAIYCKKSVLVICEKPAALEVIKKRLDGIQLGDLVCYIQNIVSDRALVINSIKDIITYPNPITSGYLGFGQQEISRIKTIESKIKEYNQFLEHRIGDLNITDLQAFRFNYGGKSIIGKSKISIKEELLGFKSIHDKIRDKSTLKIYLDSILENINLYRAIKYNENLFSEKNTKIKTSENQEMISSHLKSIVDRIGRHPLKKNEFKNLGWLVFSQFLNAEKFSRDYNKINDVKLSIFDTLSGIKGIITKKQFSIIKRNIEDTNIEELKSIFEMSRDLPKISRIFDYLEENPELKLFFDKNIEYLEESACFMVDAIFTLIREKIFGEIGKDVNCNSREIDDLKEELKSLLVRQREFNKASILKIYKDRANFAKILEANDLLAIRTSSNRKKTTIRDIFTHKVKDSSSLTAFNIFPVLLATPDVACSILPLEEGIIDYIVIDEASQMYVDISLPIIFRGKKLIVSGDENQMPPSNFFQNQSDFYDDEESEVISAAINETSLLDATNRIISPESKHKCQLKVHYRSDHKALIDFSNHAFYNGSLISPTTNQSFFSSIKTPIILKKIEGNYNASKNEKEAYEIIKTLKEIWKQKDPPTLGIIVFNENQKNLINDILYSLCLDDPDFSAILEREKSRKENGEHTGFFIRSVEHVQGDERDVIILGTVYGKGIRNYGPIIKQNGRKRLNVAITRAKKGIIVITSLEIDKISNDSQKDQKEIYYFWKFMKYAEFISNKNKEGISGLLESLSSKKSPLTKVKQPESPFEESVSKYIKELGYHVEYQVSEDEFRIDLGIKIKKEDSTFICGIECDGRMYHSSWDARHNDIWRQSILESKGWKIIRIWGDDWYLNIENAKRKLAEQLKNLSITP